MANYLGTKCSEMLFEWLRRADPDDRHRVADHWNWDEGEDVLRWIIQQDDCDKATALLIFWRGEPYDFCVLGASTRDELIQAKLRGKYVELDRYDMLAEIVARWKGGKYTRSELFWSAEEAMGPEFVEISDKHPPLAITYDMLSPLAGRELDWGDFEEGIPGDIWFATRNQR